MSEDTALQSLVDAEKKATDTINELLQSDPKTKHIEMIGFYHEQGCFKDAKANPQYQATKMTEPSRRAPVLLQEAMQRHNALYREYNDDFTKTFLDKPSDGTYLFFGDKDIPRINEFWSHYQVFLAAQHMLPVIAADLIGDDSVDQKVVKTQWFYFHGLPTYIKSCNITHRSIDGKAIVPVGVKWVSTVEVAASPPSSLDLPQ